MPRKLIIVGAVVGAIVLLLLLRRKANAASMPHAGATMSPGAALATLTTAPPRQIAAAGVQYVAGQIADGINPAIPQNTPKPLPTTGELCPTGYTGTSPVDPSVRCPLGSNKFSSIGAAANKVLALNYNPSVGYYG